MNCEGQSRTPHGTRIMVHAALALCALLLCSGPPILASQTAIDPIGSDPGAEALPLEGPNEYLGTEPLEIVALGIVVRDGKTKLDDGHPVNGVAVIDVFPTGPSRDALRSHRTARYVMTGLLIGAGAAAMVFFPPAIMAIPLVINAGVEQSYDVIIGVDGNRVRNTFELFQAVQNAQPGDVFYLTVVRKARRMQVTVSIPATQ